jgi:hypothetical protein
MRGAGRNKMRKTFRDCVACNGQDTLPFPGQKEADDEEERRRRHLSFERKVEPLVADEYTMTGIEHVTSEIRCLFQNKAILWRKRINNKDISCKEDIKD